MDRLPALTAVFRKFTTIRRTIHAELNGTNAASQFAPGAAIAQAGTIREIRRIYSASGYRLRFKASVAGTLVAKFLRPGLIDGEEETFRAELDGADLVCDTGNPASVAVSADTEALLEIALGGILGECYLLLEFTEGNVAPGTVTYAADCQL